MTQLMLAFGDSNTYGTKPMHSTGDNRRYGPEARWPRVAEAGLRGAWEVVEEGLPGRTTQMDDPVMGRHMNARLGLRIALQSHGPIDLLAILLGTNDHKTRFAPTPERVTAGIAGLVDIALSEEYQTRHDGFEVLVICPPPVLEQGPIMGEFLGAAAPSRALASVLRPKCAARGVHFLDAGAVIASSDQDGVHFEPDAQRALGAAVAGLVAAL
jgi:lysophospholipase L1-like esterase